MVGGYLPLVEESVGGLRRVAGLESLDQRARYPVLQRKY